MKNKVFIFGVSGFIGKTLLKNLPSEWKKIGVGRNDEELFFDLQSSKPDDLNEKISKGDYWIFLAAVSSPDQCEINSNFAFNLNVDKTKKLLEWLTGKGVKVIFASSDAVYGNKHGTAYDNDKMYPMGEYARHKALIENFVSNNSHVKIMRLSYVLGFDDKFSNLVRQHESSKMKLDVFKGFKRHVVLIDDVVLGVKNLINNWNHFNFQSINFSGHALVDRCDMAAMLKNKFFKGLDYNCVEPPDSFWVGRTKKISLDCTNFKLVLGRLPKSINQI